MENFARSSITNIPNIFRNIKSGEGHTLNGTFARCEKLIEIDDNFCFPSDLMLESAFYGCTNLVKIPQNLLKNSGTNIMIKNGLFCDCVNLELDITDFFDLQKMLTCHFEYMFMNCPKITGTFPLNEYFAAGNASIPIFQDCPNITNYAELVANGIAS